MPGELLVYDHVIQSVDVMMSPGRDPGDQLRGVAAALPAQQHQASLCPPGAVQLTRVTQIGGQAPGDISQVDTGGDHVTNLNT